TMVAAADPPAVASAGGTAEDPLADLARHLRLGRGRFTLLFAWYDRPGQRPRLAARLRQALPGWTLAEASLQDSSLDLRRRTVRFFEDLWAIARRNVEGRPV